ncbi:patatin-like phospholipase family protein [Archangium violaceum]|uniref:patatin-like phospholipase family protein n=1 Tax=Archangium violaceum TaxID=83451 RepID=UPI00193B0420|nr:patatin-like phospholipase family protein [Archangium violaceum]QRK10143.1 patatin-like phospholipase family protein [Archangium violaceum]
MELERVRSWWRGETSQPLRPLVEWLGRCPLLLVLQALPVSIVWGAFEALGLPSLFFHDVPRVTFVAAFMAAMLLGQLCFIGYLLDADEPWALAPRRGKPGGVPPTIRWYLFRTGTYPAWLVLLSIPSLIDRHFAFLFGVLAAVGVMLLLTRGAEWLQRWYESDRRRHRWMRLVEVLLFSRRATHIMVLHVLQAGLLALFVLGYLLVAAHVAFTGNHGWVSPAVVICTAIGLCGAVYGAVRFFFPLHHMGALIVGGVLIVFVGRGCSDVSFYDELSLPQPPAYASASLASPRDAGLLADDAVLDAWLARMRTEPPPGVAWSTRGETQQMSGRTAMRCEPGPKPRLALVATSGGGIRAAAWTAHVLSKLQGPDGVPGFHRYVRLVTGASGGMVGAGAWVAGLQRQGLSDPVALTEMMQRDSLSSAAIALLLPFGDNRGRSLEQAWVNHTGGLLGRSFQELRAGEAEGWLPSLVYSPMLVEDGRRLLVSNLDLSALTASEASTLVVERNGDEPHEGQRALLSLSGVQLFQLFPNKQPVFSVAAAARMSASFPYVSPASALPTSPRVRVVDAGYYDNYGVDLAVLWLHTHREWVRECTSGVVLIQIRDHLGNGRRTKLQAAGAGELLGGLTSPVEAVLRARESSMSFRNDELLSLVQDELNGGEPCFFTTAIFEFSESAPLSWALTTHDTARLERAASSPALQSRVDAVREWLTADPEARERASALGLCPGGRALMP